MKIPEYLESKSKIIFVNFLSNGTPYDYLYTLFEKKREFLTLQKGNGNAHLAINKTKGISNEKLDIEYSQNKAILVEELIDLV